MTATTAPRPAVSRLEAGAAGTALRHHHRDQRRRCRSIPADLIRKAEPLRGLADAVNVTDGASARAHLGAPIAAAILVQAGIEPILQLTCRDRNRIALQGRSDGRGRDRRASTC